MGVVWSQPSILLRAWQTFQKSLDTLYQGVECTFLCDNVVRSDIFKRLEWRALKPKLLKIGVFGRDLRHRKKQPTLAVMN